MRSLKPYAWLCAAMLLLLQVSARSPGLDKFLKDKQERMNRRMHQNPKRTAPASPATSKATSTFSSSVPAYSASSTFIISSGLSGTTRVEPTPTPASCRSSDCKFYSGKTAPYFIDSWPDVDFETGEFYGGSVPINESDPTRTLFWIFKPAEGEPVKEIAIWLNGGPGCSSLEGFLQENGPISWRPGTAQPVENPFAWSTLTNMLWVEQPVGTGFTQGKATATNEVDVAKDFVGFFKNWEKIFGIENYKIYITGESYAGRYVPYISAEMLNMNDKTYFDLSGALMYDPCIGDCLGPVQAGLPLGQFAVENQNIFNLNPLTLATIQNVSSTCGMDAYLETYLQFPPPGSQPRDHQIYNQTYGCGEVYLGFASDVYSKNPCYDDYHVINYCPILSNNLDEYFNRADVKKAIHAPLNVTWEQCTTRQVFVGGKDTSPLSIEGALPQVIEATNRVLVSNGDWDGLLYTNGTLLSIQNMTWNGQLGFQTQPSEDFWVPLALGKFGHPQGVMGKALYERGLMWVETYQAGHQQPQYQPRAAWRQLQWVLGRIDTLWQ